jgi:Flp pilus assembly protein TadD
MAQVFADHPCRDECLATAATPGKDSKQILPESLDELRSLLPGYELLGKALGQERSGASRAAIKTYLHAASVAPDQAGILSRLGMAYLRAGDLQSARLHLERADKLQPEYYRTKMGLGYLYLQMGKVRQAKTYLAGSVELLPVAENLFLYAESLAKSDDISAARVRYELVVEHDRFSKLGRKAAKRLKRIGKD